MLVFKSIGKSISFGEFDSDKELEIETISSDGDYSSFWLSPNQVNDVIIQLARQLKSIGEPVLLLEEKKK